jgi:hypothetical protein
VCQGAATSEEVGNAPEDGRDGDSRGADGAPSEIVVGDVPHAGAEGEPVAEQRRMRGTATHERKWGRISRGRGRYRGYYGLFTVDEERNRREFLILKQFMPSMSVFDGIANWVLKCVRRLYSVSILKFVLCRRCGWLQSTRLGTVDEDQRRSRCRSEISEGPVRTSLPACDSSRRTSTTCNPIALNLSRRSFIC